MIRRVLVNVQLPDYLLEKLQKKYPELTFTVVARDSADLEQYLSDAEILLSFQCSLEMLTSAPQLRWIQLLRVGLDGAPLEEIFQKGIILTNAHGIHKVMMTEYAIAAMINLSRNAHQVYRNQLQSQWDRTVPQGEICGAKVGIIGLGNIGKEIAQKAKVFGMEVLALKNKAEDLTYVDKVYSPDQMAEIFVASDYIINLLPLTPETEGIINHKYFRLMKPSACFINIGRGATVNEQDLLEALQHKTFHAAVLDVFHEEPLPESHPFWQLDNVVLTPHFSGSSSKYLDKAFGIIDHNLEMYLQGQETAMVNLVTSGKGY